MIQQTKLCCGLIALCMVFQQFAAAEAAGENKELNARANRNIETEEAAGQVGEEESVLPAPVVFEGDDISFDNATGEVYAKGNVMIVQSDAKLTADLMYGNTKDADVWIDGRAHITQPDLALDGYDTFYNYQDREGTMAKVDGKVENKFITGENLEFYPDEVIIYNGTITRCPAKKPDYHIAARRIEIWPDDKLVAYDAKAYVKGKVIYSTKRYETKIGKNAKQNSAFPTIGFNSGDGFYLKQRVERPLGSDVAAYADIGYYSKHDFRSEYGVAKYNKDYTVTLHAGDFQDDDDEWITKEPELRVDFGRKRLWDTPFRYDINASVGRWSDDVKRSWHQEYNVYFSRDPILLDETMKLYLGAGYNFIKESYDGSRISTLKQDITLAKAFSPRFTAWTGYHYTKKNNTRTLFNYESADVAQELASGFNYRIDAKNSIGVSQSYDLENNRTADMDYTWYRDLHCWQVALTYREKRDQWKVKASVMSW